MNKIHTLALVLLCAACSTKESRVQEVFDMSSAEAPIEKSTALQISNTQSANHNPAASQLQIIKTANYKFQVANVDSSVLAIERSVAFYGGTVADMNQETSNREITGMITIRVPAERFESLLAAVGKQAVFTNYKKISTEDVTEEFIDIQTRLKTKKEVRDRYIDILTKKAKTVKDVLDAEEQIRVLQEEIEAKEGRLKYLSSRIAQSTINLEIYQTVEYQPVPDTHQTAYFSQVADGFSNGWKIITGSVLVLVNIWPFLILIALFFWKRKWLRAKMN